MQVRRGAASERIPLQEIFVEEQLEPHARVSPSGSPARQAALLTSLPGVNTPGATQSRSITHARFCPSSIRSGTNAIGFAAREPERREPARVQVFTTDSALVSPCSALTPLMP